MRHQVKINPKTLKNLKHTPTKKLQAIISENYTRGVNGTDYEPYRDIINEILWLRADKAAQASATARKRAIKKEHTKYLNEYKAFRSLLKTCGDSKELRDDINNSMRRYEEFCNAI